MLFLRSRAIIKRILSAWIIERILAKIIECILRQLSNAFCVNYQMYFASIIKCILLQLSNVFCFNYRTYFGKIIERILVNIIEWILYKSTNVSTFLSNVLRIIEYIYVYRIQKRNIEYWHISATILEGLNFFCLRNLLSANCEVN